MIYNLMGLKMGINNLAIVLTIGRDTFTFFRRANIFGKLSIYRDA